VSRGDLIILKKSSAGKVTLKTNWDATRINSSLMMLTLLNKKPRKSKRQIGPVIDIENKIDSPNIISPFLSENKAKYIVALFQVHESKNHSHVFYSSISNNYPLS
jgi:hypothetical protein